MNTMLNALQHAMREIDLKSGELLNDNEVHNDISLAFEFNNETHSLVGHVCLVETEQGYDLDTELELIGEYSHRITEEEINVLLYNTL